MPNVNDGGVRTPLTNLASQIRNYGLTFTTFSPGTPISPAEQQPVRGFDFPVNFNATVRPRPYEPISFAQLKAWANVELVRLAIETRKDQIEGYEWAIKPKGNKRKSDARCAALTTFFAKPDGVTPFAAFVRVLMEDLLAIDAPCMELRRTRGGKLIGLEIVQGDTISPKVDANGRVPTDPDALAYQQVIKGVVWADLTRKDILYLPRNVRSGHVYGFSPVEQIIVTINTIMRRQAAQLAHFTASNVPAGMMNAPEGWQLDKIKELQDWLDDKISGNQSEQAKLIWGPAGSKYQAFKDAPIKDEFDEWLARVVAYAFSLPPTPFIKQMNRSTAESDQDRALTEGLGPLLRWVKRWVDHIIHTEFGYDDIEFEWIDPTSIDAPAQNGMDDKNVRNGSSTLDEIRDRRGEEPLPDGLGSEPLIFTASGVMRLRDALAASERDAQEPKQVPPALAAHAAQGAQAGNGGGNQAAGPAPAQSEGETEAEKLAKAAADAITIQRATARKAIGLVKKKALGILTATAKTVADQVEEALSETQKKDEPHPADSVLRASQIAMKVDLSELLAINSAVEGDLSDMAQDSASLALSAVGAEDMMDDGLVNQVFKDAADWAGQRAGELISTEQPRLRAEIRDIIADGLNSNIGAAAIADNIRKASGFSEDRAILIAQTEIAEANESGKMLGWQAAEDAGLVLKKSWLKTTAGKPCCDKCAANTAAGEIDLNAAFPSGHVHAPAHPRCQCATTSRVVTDEEED